MKAQKSVFGKIVQVDGKFLFEDSAGKQFLIPEFNEEGTNLFKRVRQSGVSILSYFISDGYYGSSKNQFEKMYGKDSEFIDVNNMTQLAKTLNKKFEVKI